MRQYMGSAIFRSIMAWFSDGEARESERRLRAGNEAELVADIAALTAGQMGWISFEDHARLFSPTGEEPGEWDQEGLRRFGEFAAAHRCDAVRRPAERRVYLIKK